MTAKQDILDLVQEFPDIFTFDEAIVRLSKLYTVPLSVELKEHGKKATPGAVFPLKKAQIIESFQRLPDELPHDKTIDEAVDWLYVILKVEIGLEEIKSGDVIPHEEVKQRLAKWRHWNRLEYNELTPETALSESGFSGLKD
jgi:hypothetical protein